MPSRPACDVPSLVKITTEFYASGRRTVSFRDFELRYQREFDARFIERVVELLPAVVDALNARDLPSVLVNDYCVRHHAETPISDIAEARRCNVFNSGGKPAVGIRRAMLDDLVRPEVNGSLAHLNVGGLRHAVQSNVNDVAAGISAPESHQRLVSTLRNELPKIADTTADPIQGRLTDGDDEADETA